MKKIIIKPVAGYEGYYNITSDGRIYSLYKNGNKLMVSKLNKKGYPELALSKDTVEKRHSIHRLIAQTFIPNPENKPCVNHKNAIKTDFSIENLEWVTYKENLTHAQNLNLMNYHKVRGENHKNSILTKSKVFEIREKLKLGIKTRVIAEEYNVSVSAINHIKYGTRWGTV